MIDLMQWWRTSPLPAKPRLLLGKGPRGSSLIEELQRKIAEEDNAVPPDRSDVLQ